MKPVVALLLASGGLALLWAAERALDARRLGAGTPIERLVPPERLADRTVAAFTLAQGAEQRLYVRSKGLWRCREAFGAVCDADRVAAFLSAVVEGRGALVCADEGCAGAFGFGGADGLRVVLHGPKVLSAPDQDALATVEYAPANASGAVFARAGDAARVLDADRDPRAALEFRGAPAPLVDTRVLAGLLGPGFRGLERIFVDRTDGALELTSAAPESESEERRWFLQSGGARTETLTWRVGGYVSLWVRLRWDAILDPRSVAGLGLDPPFARITLVANTAEVWEIWVSRPDPANRVHLWNRATNVVAAVRGELLPLLVPDPAAFTRREGGNPWEAWLAPR